MTTSPKRRDIIQAPIAHDWMIPQHAPQFPAVMKSKHHKHCFGDLLFAIIAATATTANAQCVAIDLTFPDRTESFSSGLNNLGAAGGPQSGSEEFLDRAFSFSTK